MHTHAHFVCTVNLSSSHMKTAVKERGTTQRECDERELENKEHRGTSLFLSFARWGGKECITRGRELEREKKKRKKKTETKRETEST